MTGIEKGTLIKLFNRDGYVLDFSTNEFDTFTMESIGVPLCEHYQMSKGRSLTAYCNDATEEEVVKLLGDLFQYYEMNFLPSSWDNDKNFQALYEKCKIIMEHEQSAVLVETPTLKSINRQYIIDLSARAIRDVENGEYDSAITKSRTLLEEVFFKAIEEKGEIPSESGDINKLYNQVKQLYSMHQTKEYDKRINSLLSGLEKILSAIAEMRNKSSDSHGVGAKRVQISEHHARLFVNSAMTMADFILSVSLNAKKEGSRDTSA